MTLLLVILFISGYILIALEHQTGINKSAIALLLGTLLWTLIPHTDNEIINHLGDTAEILFYLLGAMTIVEWIDTHNGFTLITNHITTRNKRKLLWIIALITFIMSSVLDNLTTAIVMIMLLRRLVNEQQERWIFGSIVIIAATNRPDVLDPALLRSGRFDRRVTVNLPDIKGREEILQVHAKNKPLGDDVDLKQIAQTTAGFTGADLENLLNEAAIIAAKEDRAYITQTDIKKAFVKVGIGAEKKSRVISEKEKRITAFHESGHAILFHLLPDVGPVYSVSIIPTGAGAAGYTMPLPERDDMFMTKGRMLQEIMVSLGGRIAEEIIFDDITTGASSDIKKATQIAKKMVTRYGMSENVGVICYDDDDDEVFIGRDLAHAKAHSELVSGEIDREIHRIIDECYAKAKALILENSDVLHKSAQLLLKKEKISRAEFEALFEKQPEDFFA